MVIQTLLNSSWFGENALLFVKEVFKLIAQAVAVTRSDSVSFTVLVTVNPNMGLCFWISVLFHGLSAAVVQKFLAKQYQIGIHKFTTNAN